MQHHVELASVKLVNQALHLAGGVSFANVMQLKKQGIELLQGVKSVQINLTGLQQGNSSTLALLFAWLRHCQTNHIEVSIKKIPSWLTAIARLCDVITLLPVAD